MKKELYALPWGTDDYLTDKQFYNRVDEITFISNLLKSTETTSPPTIMIPGFRGVGKTVLLKKIQKELDNDYLICYLDLSLSYFYQIQNLNEINLMQFFYMSWIEACEKKGFNMTLDKIKKFFKTNKFKVQEIKNFGEYPVPIPEKEIDNAELMKFVLNLPQEIYENHNNKIKGVIMIIDEFQALKDLRDGLNGFLWLFRSIIQSQKNVAYVFSGSLNSKDEIIDKMASKNGAFGGRMLTIEIHPFSKDTTKNYLNEKVPALLFDENGFERFYLCTQGIPHYINTFANILPKNVILDKKDIQNEFKNILPILADHLRCQWAVLDLNQQFILTSLINDPLKRKDIGEKISIAPNSLSRPLRKLLNSGLIENNNGKYNISDYILKAWLKHEYEKYGVFPFRV
ncbi:MAG: ATP-binding protein [Methanobrevibacter sp.]|jgi:predicted AAA+ superfamily ATPase|nr:ATP-binding protein [Candidatus Methanoflexus mossambicus]